MFWLVIADFFLVIVISMTVALDNSVRDVCCKCTVHSKI